MRTQVGNVEQFLAAGGDLRSTVIQGLDLAALQDYAWDGLEVEDAWFLGCRFPTRDVALALARRGATLFPGFDERLPYNPYRSTLYTSAELLTGVDRETGKSLDAQIFDHFTQGRRTRDVLEALAQRIHDHAIDNALEVLLESGPGGEPRQVVGIMGGHTVRRGDEFYRRTAHLARLLTREGYFVATGGGPGVMEAGNLGARLCRREPEEIDRAVAFLGQETDFYQPRYTELALQLADEHPDGGESLAVPTWFYGHEPVNAFASHVAKYFSNSIREDGLLAIALHGVVYAPGGFGTLQEIFQDLAQNHYGSFGCRSPMVFFGRFRYEEQTSIYALVRQVTEGKDYARLITISDEPEEIVAFLRSHPPS